MYTKCIKLFILFNTHCVLKNKSLVFINEGITKYRLKFYKYRWFISDTITKISTMKNILQRLTCYLTGQDK